MCSSDLCILASNHCSLLDPPVLVCPVTHRVVHCLARDTLFRGVGAWLLPRLGAVPLSRGRGDVGALRKALGILAQGQVLGLFPEGARSPDGEIRPAKGGLGFLVSKARAPVVPVYIDGSFAAWPKGAWRPRLHPIRVTYGEAITPAQIAAHGTTREAYERISSLVMARIAALRDDDDGTAMDVPLGERDGAAQDRPPSEPAVLAVPADDVRHLVAERPRRLEAQVARRL